MEKTLIAEISGWLGEAADLIRERLKSPLIVEQKTGAADVVTNVDKEVERFFVEKISLAYPTDKILGEEGMSDKKLEDLSGRVWVIDPIDGTLNFVKQQDNFCIMLALYDNGIGKLGFIYEVMRGELLWGGKDFGVYLNDRRIDKAKELSLADGIINVNTTMFVKNDYYTQEIARTAIGVRMTGCAGIGFKEVILGKENAYISKLQPWDYAAGKVLAEELGIIVKSLNQTALDLSKQEPILVALPATYEDIRKKWQI